MNFYYDPILGLKYEFVKAKPKTFTAKDFKPVGSKFFKKRETRRDN